MGVKAIVSHLNARRIFTRDGGRWGIGQLHRILTRRTYIGEHEFNKRSKTKELKPISEIVTVPVPPLIDLETFDAVQTHLKARNPKVTPPRVVSGPTLLTGICFCAKCGGAMTIRTGKGGRYRYYTCSIKARQGETGCSGRSIPMEKLDTIVAGHIEDRLLQPDRLEEVLSSVLDRRHEAGRTSAGAYRRVERPGGPRPTFASSASMTRSNQASPISPIGVERPHRRVEGASRPGAGGCRAGASHA